MSHITMESHHFQWVNPLSMAIFNSRLLVITRPGMSQIWGWHEGNAWREPLSCWARAADQLYLWKDHGWRQQNTSGLNHGMVNPTQKPRQIRQFLPFWIKKTQESSRFFGNTQFGVLFAKLNSWGLLDLVHITSYHIISHHITSYHHMT